jgi:biotin-dependent carboxylase-like uncharacterized protein
MIQALEVQAVRGPAWVQDGGRTGLLHQGVPAGGALIPELLAISNRVLGNAPFAPGVELYGGLTIAAATVGLVAVDGAAVRVSPGETLQIEPPRQRRAKYLALPGGVDVPEWLGGFGTLDAIALGGYEGRSLRRGDVLRSSAAVARTTAGAGPLVWEARPPPFRVVPGPDFDAFAREALECLTTSDFAVSPSSNRVGTRITGAAIPRRTADGGLSAPMLRGAIQVPAAGEPVVLGPDHPTLGGYPVVAVLIRADQGAFCSLRPGSPVRFELIELAAARAASTRWAEDWTR